jgi:hypothetical protein
VFKRSLTALTVTVAAASLCLPTPASATLPPDAYPPGCAVVTSDASAYAPGAVITLVATATPADEGSQITFTVTLTNGGTIDLPSLKVAPQGHGLGFSANVARPQSSTTSIVVTAIVDAAGLAQVTITAPLTIGDYTVTISELLCGEVSSSFVITPDVPATTTTVPGFPPGTTPGRVPSAGSNIEPWLVGATALVASGLMLWVATRRRRQASHA